MKLNVLRLWSLVVVLSLAVLPVRAQETRGNISGTVKDSTGVIPGATVEIRSTDTGATQTLVTNSSGYFEAPLMQPGNYAISVEMAGFKDIPHLMCPIINETGRATSVLEWACQKMDERYEFLAEAGVRNIKG